MNEYFFIQDDQIFLRHEPFYFDSFTKVFYIPLTALQSAGIEFKDLRLPGDIFGFNIKGIKNNLIFFYNSNFYKDQQHIGWLFTTVDTAPCSALLLK